MGNQPRSVKGKSTVSRRRAQSSSASRWMPSRKSRANSTCRQRGWFGRLNRALKEDFDERGEPPDLSVEEVLAWADAFFARTGDWPSQKSGEIPEAPGETWLLVTAALAFGLRGFPGGGSIPRFLDEHRGRYNKCDQRFTTNDVLAWADAWYARTGDWPQRDSGEIPGSGGVNWGIVDDSFHTGRAMLPGGASLSQFLAKTRGVIRRPPMTEEQILAWADAHHERTGQWPTSESGSIPEEPGETWTALHSALGKGLRGLSGGTTLTELLFKRRGVPSLYYAPRPTIPQILAWADAFHARTGRWPQRNSGPIPEAPGETWKTVDSALRGHRGLPPGSSLTRLLVQERGLRSWRYVPPFSIPQILAWADAFRARNGRWPNERSGPVDEAPGETWLRIQTALVEGLRGLQGGSSLSRLLAAERGVRQGKDGRAISVAEILQWADAHRARHGAWPDEQSGPIPEAAGENWRIVKSALKVGRRGLPAGSSIALLLAEHRGWRHRRHLPKLTIAQVLAWADAYHARTGRWPSAVSGPIPESSGDKWSTVNSALANGHRGLPGGMSVTRLIDRERRATTPTVTAANNQPPHARRAAADRGRASLSAKGEAPQDRTADNADGLPAVTTSAICSSMTWATCKEPTPLFRDSQPQFAKRK
jgi:hypothetical protein